MKAIRNLVAILLVSGASLAHGGGAVGYEVDSKQSPVTFLAVGKPGFLRIKGEGASLNGSAELADGAVKGSFKVVLADFKTGIDMRDQHMKEKYLEVGKFPEATLLIDPIKVSLSGNESADFTGQFTMKGKSKAVKGTAKLTSQGDKVDGEAKFSISLADYDVGIPSHLGVKVAEEVEITVKIMAAKKAANAH